MEIWIPESAKEFAEKRPFRCRLCSDRFSSPTSLAFHIRGHDKREEAEIRERSLRHRAPGLLGDEGVDTEYEQYWKNKFRTNRGYRGAI